MLGFRLQGNDGILYSHYVLSQEGEKGVENILVRRATNGILYSNM
jgi:hypothetical protein